MRKRNMQIIVRLNEKEHCHFTKMVAKSGLSKEAYIRYLINGLVPKDDPPPDYYSMMRELHAIGNNLNQIAAKANGLGKIDASFYQQQADKLYKAILKISAAVLLPQKNE